MPTTAPDIALLAANDQLEAEVGRLRYQLNNIRRMARRTLHDAELPPVALPWDGEPGTTEHLAAALTAIADFDDALPTP